MTHTSRHQQPIKLRKLALIAVATAVVTIASAATAHATERPPSFQSPSGNITCWVADNVVSCVLFNRTYAPPLGNCALAQNFDWRHFALLKGQSPELLCDRNYDNPPSPMTLDYGQRYSAGVMTCDSEISGVTCTDTSTGHFFRASRESYQLG
jgi:hypothetical protein